MTVVPASTMSRRALCVFTLLWLTELATAFVIAPRRLAPARADTTPSATTTTRLDSTFFGKEDDDDDDDDEDLVKVPRRGRRRERRAYYEDDDEDDDAYETDPVGYDDSLDDKDDSSDDEDDDWLLEDLENNLFDNVVIPNPLLDSIDPDGAADRFPELASDPRFWFDMVVFIAFLNFLSSVGPRDPFPDIPWY